MARVKSLGCICSRHMDDLGAKDESPHSALYTLQYATALTVHTAASVTRLFRSGGCDIALWSRRHYVLHGHLWICGNQSPKF